jgi:hypothetical protein
MTNKPHLVLGALNGDDIGHEIVPASVEVASAAAMLHGLSIDWRPMPVGRRALDTHGSTLPEGTLETLQKMDGFVLGPIGHRDYPKGPGAINPHPIMRKHFNLFANVRPTRSYPDIGCLYDNVDLIIVRENNEGFQPDRNMLLGTPSSAPPTTSRCRCASSRAWQRARGPRRAGTGALAPQAGDRGAQEHGVQAGLRHVRGGVPQGRQGLPRRHRQRGHRRHHGHAPGARPAQLRRRGHHQYVRRHPVRRGGRAGGRPGHGARACA